MTTLKRVAVFVGWPLLLLAVVLGILAWWDISYQQKYLPIAESLVGADLGTPYARVEGRTVEVNAITDVVTSSPADLSGARAGDIILGIADKQPAADYFAFEAGYSTTKLVRKIMKAAGGEPVDLVVLRPISPAYDTTHTRLILKLSVPPAN